MPDFTALAAAAGSPARSSWLWYAELSTVPRIAAPRAAPTWRKAVISADPAPLRSADRAPRAAFMAEGIARPSPAPATANQAAPKPVPLWTLVEAPVARAAAITANPVATRALALTRGAGGTARSPASGVFGGLCSR